MLSSTIILTGFVSCVSVDLADGLSATASTPLPDASNTHPLDTATKGHFGTTNVAPQDTSRTTQGTVTPGKSYSDAEVQTSFPVGIADGYGTSTVRHPTCPTYITTDGLVIRVPQVWTIAGVSSPITPTYVFLIYH